MAEDSIGQRLKIALPNLRVPVNDEEDMRSAGSEVAMLGSSSVQANIRRRMQGSGTPGTLSPTPQVGIFASENWSIYDEDEKNILVGIPELSSEKPECTNPRSEVKLKQGAKCCDCGTWLPAGRSAFQCPSCPDAQCLDCHWMDDLDDAFVGVVSDRADAYGFTGEMMAAGEAVTVDMARSVSNSSLKSAKHCRLCGQPYKGFGDVCSDCRNNPGGETRECKVCGSFFKGYGLRCEDCKATMDDDAWSANNAPAVVITPTNAAS